MKKEIKTVKDLMENEELASFVTEDLEDFEETAEVSYEVWAIGYTADAEVTDNEMLINSFADPDEAIKFAKQLDLADLVEFAAEELGAEYPDAEIAYISLEVETVVDTEDLQTIQNVGTIFKKIICVEEEPEEDSCEDAVQLTENDYTLLENGSLVVPLTLMKGYNKNDYVRIRFIDEDAEPILTYKIISRTTGSFEGVDAFVCEFEY